MAIDKEALSRSLRDVHESTESYLQLFAVQAPLIRAKYNALLKAGFSEAQALELCKAPLVQ